MHMSISYLPTTPGGFIKSNMQLELDLPQRITVECQSPSKKRRKEMRRLTVARVCALE